MQQRKIKNVKREYYLEPENYQGEVSVEESRIPFRASVYVKADLRLIFKVAPLTGSSASRKYATIHNALVVGKPLPKSSLIAKSKNGKDLESDHVNCLPGKTNFTRSHFSIEPQTAKLKFTLPQKCENPSLIMRLRGFRCFKCQPVETPLGCIAIWGKPQGVSKDDVSGGIGIEIPRGNQMPSWEKEAELFLDFVRKGLGLANGGRLQTPVIEYREEDSCEVIFYSGHGFQREFPICFPTMLQPYFNILAKRYFQSPPIPEILWTALSWMQSETTFDEIRFLTGMTAIESIISNIPKHQLKVLPEEQFKHFSKLLKNTIQSLNGLGKDLAKHFRRGVGTLNNKLLAENIAGLFDYFGSSRDRVGQFIFP